MTNKSSDSIYKTHIQKLKICKIKKSFVFEFDKNENIINKEAINLLDNKSHKYNKIETQDAWLFIKDNNENIEYKVQIKGNTTSRKSNLKFEPTEVGKGAARMGKATREYIFDLMKSYGIKRHFPESADNYPLTEDEFKGYDPKTLRMIGNQKAYVKMLKDIRTIMGSQNVDYGVDPITGVINLAEVFSEDSQPWIANMKLQEIRFIWAIVVGLRTKEKINQFCTDLIYIAAKQGRSAGPYGTGYGPFGKIYQTVIQLAQSLIQLGFSVL